MLKSGFGDMPAKYVSIAEWRISHLITGEYYCERVAELIRTALKQCVDNAESLLNRDEEAVTKDKRSNRFKTKEAISNKKHSR